MRASSNCTVRLVSRCRRRIRAIPLEATVPGLWKLGMTLAANEVVALRYISPGARFALPLKNICRLIALQPFRQLSRPALHLDVALAIAIVEGTLTRL